MPAKIIIPPCEVGSRRLVCNGCLCTFDIPESESDKKTSACSSFTYLSCNCPGCGDEKTFAFRGL